MSVVHVVLQLAAEDAESDVTWEMAVFDSRAKALDHACETLRIAGYSQAELDFARGDLTHSNVHVATSLGSMLHVLIPEVH
jgi:hypothetical protein